MVLVNLIYLTSDDYNRNNGIQGYVNTGQAFVPNDVTAGGIGAGISHRGLSCPDTALLSPPKYGSRHYWEDQLSYDCVGVNVGEITWNTLAGIVAFDAFQIGNIQPRMGSRHYCYISDGNPCVANRGWLSSKTNVSGNSWTHSGCRTTYCGISNMGETGADGHVAKGSREPRLFV